MDKLCSQCQLAFQAKRVTARYCSPKCRNDAFRGVSVVNDSVAIVSVAQKKAVSVVTDIPRMYMLCLHSQGEDA